MTITAANQVNKVLQAMVNLVEVSGVPPQEELVEAAVLLADRAYSVLHAGFNGERIREALT